MSATWSVQARWVFPVDQPPLRDGVLTLCGDKIVAVEPAGIRTPDHKLSNAAILPGLVNAHTHLDLGALRGKLPPPSDFTQWLRAVVAYRQNSSPTDWKQAIQEGIEQSLLSGTTLVRDISYGGHSVPLLEAAPIHGDVYLELIGLTRARARHAWQEAQAWMQAHHPDIMVNKHGLSPHAPYTVRSSLFQRLVRQPVRLAIHFAESPFEQELLEKKSGPLREFLEELGAWDGDALVGDHASLVAMLSQPGGWPFPRPLSTFYVHANYIAPELLPLLRRATVVYCPRTHHYFGHANHPFRQILAAGVQVALGTDSLASNPDLSILEEMRFLWRQASPRVAGDMLLWMGTSGSGLAPGRSADWIAVELPNTEPRDPYELLFDSTLPVRHVAINGAWVVRHGQLVGAATT